MSDKQLVTGASVKVLSTEASIKEYEKKIEDARVHVPENVPTLRRKLTILRRLKPEHIFTNVGVINRADGPEPFFVSVTYGYVGGILILSSEVEPV